MRYVSNLRRAISAGIVKIRTERDDALARVAELEAENHRLNEQVKAMLRHRWCTGGHLVLPADSNNVRRCEACDTIARLQVANDTLSAELEARG